VSGQAKLRQTTCIDCEYLKTALEAAIEGYAKAQKACSLEPADSLLFDRQQARRIIADFAWHQARQDLATHQATHTLK